MGGHRKNNCEVKIIEKDFWTGEVLNKTEPTEANLKKDKGLKKNDRLKQEAHWNNEKLQHIPDGPHNDTQDGYIKKGPKKKKAG